MLLVQRAQRGDAEAFDVLARHYRPALRALTFLRTSDLQEAEDLTQEALTCAWQRLPTLQAPASFLPWLKAIVANACNSWYRRARFRPLSLESEPASVSQLASEAMPLQVLLAKERERELRQALAALPDANRLALMLHVWGGYSYEEIARFAATPLTTVEGRIHRARQQLRSLLRDEGAAFLGEARPRRPKRKQTKSEPQRSPIMSKAVSPTVSPELLKAFGMLQFTRRFSALVDSGFSLVRTLHILEEIPPPYGEAIRSIRLEVEEGHRLSSSMERFPQLFTIHYIALLRAGEVGGILEETLRRTAGLAAKEWKMILRSPANHDPLFLIGPVFKPLPEDWSGLSPYQQAATLILFCDTFSLLLRSGVPILRTMTTVSTLMPKQQQAGILAAREEIHQGNRIITELEAMGIFPRIVIEMIDKGEEQGSLDLMLERIAALLQYELDCRLMAEEPSALD